MQVLRLGEQTADLGPRLSEFLRSHPSSGWIRLALECDGMFARGARPGLESVDCLFREKGGAIDAYAARSVFQGTAEGGPALFGVLGELRINAGEKSGAVFLRGVREMVKLDREMPVRCTVATIMEDNEPALKMASRSSAHSLRFELAGRYLTFILPALGSHKSNRHGSVLTTTDPSFCAVPVQTRVAGPGDRDQLIELWRRAGREQPLFPWIDPESLRPERTFLRGEGIDEILLACRGTEIVGALALFDPSPFRRWVVDGYRAPLSIIRPMLNFYARQKGRALLPNRGEMFPYRLIRCCAVDGQNSAVLDALLTAAQNQMAHLPDRPALVLGLDERDWRITAAKHRSQRVLASRFFTVALNGMAPRWRWPANAVPYLDIALV